MNERRRFLQVIGSGVVAAGAGCSAVVSGSGTGGSGTGGSGAGGGGAGGGETSTGGAGTTSTSGTGTTSTTGTSGTSSTSTSSTSTTATSSSGGNCTTSPPGTKLGMPTDYSSNGLHIVSGKGVLIGRDSGGLYALTSICTHAGCDMSSSDSQGALGQLSGSDIICLCHGSEFGPTGTVINGPAFKALKAYALALGCDGFLYVNKSKTVAATVRLMA